MATTGREIELYPADFVFTDTDGCFVRFSDGQIMITADEDEIREETAYGSTPVRCTELSGEKQTELIENITRFNS